MMPHEKTAILIIGCGRMGGAMASALRTRYRVMAYDPHAKAPYGVEMIDRLNADDLPSDLIVILAIKPQLFSELEPELSAISKPDTIFLSIMAGVTISGLSKVFGSDAKIVRAMPNSPASVGYGMTVSVFSDALSINEAATITRVLEATGRCIRLKNESQIDVATAVSGSGPAYVFRFAEALVAAAITEGLDKADAEQLVRQTVIGAARLRETENRTFSELRQDVTSEGGTTEAGLDSFTHAPGIDQLAEDTVRAAASRSRDLSRLTKALK